MQRHYGMDWLRIGAFALLILYHVGMVFAPWPYHVKTAEPIEWLALAMKLTNPWRLTLLFVVSGYASRALFKKAGGLPGFVGNRSLRLLIPLGFGITVMVPPQDWVELVTQHNYPHGFGYFLIYDYFRFREINGVLTPSWNHLWFVAYLWVYTVALALLLVLPRPARAQAAFDRVFSGWRVLALPMTWLILTQIVLFHRWSDTHDVIGDGIAHLAYFPAFLFGFALGGSAPVMAAMVRWRGLAAAAAVLGYAIGAGIELVYPGGQVPPQWLGNIMLVASYVQSWGAIVALVGVAERYLNRNHPWRATLTEAVFPFYLVHQTVIVLTEFWIRPLQLSPIIEFAVLVTATIAGCWAFYLVGREVPWLRPLIGLRRLNRSLTPARRSVALAARPNASNASNGDEPASTAKVSVRPPSPRPFPGAAG